MGRQLGEGFCLCLGFRAMAGGWLGSEVKIGINVLKRSRRRIQVLKEGEKSWQE
jgi:hypothetical protein